MPETPTWPRILSSLLERDDLSVAEATWSMQQFMRGEASSAQMAAFLIALRAKGETVDEVVGFRDAILDNALSVDLPVASLDIVGTGGDRFGTVNVSSMAAIVCAAAGVPIVKHGNRAATSRSGSSDVLAALGIDLTLDADAISRVFDEVNIAFVFAANFHPGFRHAGPVRSDLGIPTVFNFLGPLCNPARPEASAVGVSQLDRVPLIAGVFQTRGATALVFRGDDGLDELTTTGHSHIWEISRGRVTEHDLDPRDLDIPLTTIDTLVGGDPAFNADVVNRVMAGERGPVRDIVVLNAAAGLVSFALSQNPEQQQLSIIDRFRSQIAVAEDAIDSGRAQTTLRAWAEATAREGAASPHDSRRGRAE